MIFEQTLKKEVVLKGIGVHSGKPSSVSISPLPAGSGIVIEDAFDKNRFLKIGKVVPLEQSHATVLRKKDFVVSTIEHLLAALRGMGIDNAKIKISGSEIPILDGSAWNFSYAFREAGLVKQSVKIEYLTPAFPLVFTEESEGRYLKLLPADKKEDTYSTDLIIKYTFQLPHFLLGKRKMNFTLVSGDTDDFENQIAPARTFGFLSFLPKLKKLGLANGVTLANTVVIGGNSFLNDLRFDDEFVRHKVLDLIGDLALVGKRLVGTVIGQNCGHNFNRLVVKRFLENPDSWINFSL